MSDDKYDLGPGELDTGDNPFYLSNPEWLSIQCYVASAINLPEDKDSMRAMLPADPPGGMDQFNDLITAYKDLHDHCEYWQNNTLPDSVKCASNIVDYNIKVPIYYGALTKLLDKLEQKPPDDKAVEQFKAIIQNLSDQAAGYSNHAGLVYKGMSDFAEQSARDSGAIKPLKEKYDKELGDQAPEIKQMSEELTTLKNELDEATKEYEHDVVVAATSATYAWIFPLGTIAAGIVAGTYGSKATKAAKRAKGISAEIGLLNDKLAASAILLLDLGRIHSDLSDISEKLAIALPIIQKLQGIWGGIRDNLENILRIIDEDISQVPAIIKSLGIDEAIDAWAKVAKEADSYRVNAYITVTTDEDVVKEAELVMQALK